MKRIAAPMIGGVITSAILELLIYPAIFVIWRKQALPKGALPAGPIGPTPAIRISRSRAFNGALAFFAASLVIAITYFVWASAIGNKNAQTANLTVPFARVTQGETAVSIMSSDGKIYPKDNILRIQFKDRDGHPVTAAGLRLDLSMNMPGMVMHSAAKVEKLDTPGEYVAHLTPEMAGDWTVDITYQGPAGPKTLELPINVSQ